MIPSAQLAALRNARHLVVFTGAGVSAESGIPTFRDSLTGLWQRFDAATLATPEAYEQDPALVWGWYEWRRMQVLKAQPNAAHRAIAALLHRNDDPPARVRIRSQRPGREAEGTGPVNWMRNSAQQLLTPRAEHPTGLCFPAAPGARAWQNELDQGGRRLTYPPPL